MASSMGKLGRAASRLLAATSAPIIPQNRSMVHKSVLKLPPDYPDPWPYKEKGFHSIDMIKDRTKPHFHQNSKLIVVEGNIGAGKSKLSAELADHLGLYYMPEFKMEDVLIDRYGNDLRNFYHLFPESFRMPDMDMFYKNPMSDMTAKMQQRIFECRFDQYLNAVAHILNTDFKHYYYVRKSAVKQLHFWPHLVVYLDTPVQKCLENVRSRGNPNEIAAVDERYLKTIEESYKDSLKEYRRHSKILAYDWSRPGDADTVVEDIERLDFDFFEWHSGDVMEEWFTVLDEVGWTGWREHVTSKLDARQYAFDGHLQHEVGELYINPRDAGHFMHVMRKEVLKSPHGYGYIKERGDPVAGLFNWRLDHVLPEPWFEYYYKELYFDGMSSMETSLDPYSDSYDPDYVHHHH
ncbi:deoxynucleoside kinase [Ostertagia ostertagi]